jgi:hypothetical protein
MERFDFLTYTDKTRAFGIGLILTLLAVWAGKNATSGQDASETFAVIGFLVGTVILVMFALTWLWAGSIRKHTTD